MPIKLFYDTETTGLLPHGKPYHDPNQPHLVQLAAILADTDTGEELSSIDLTILPDGWTIPAEVVAVHGITEGRAARVGVPLYYAVDVFTALADRSDGLVAHNADFDRRVIAAALYRAHGPNTVGWWTGRAHECTMKMARKRTGQGSLASAYAHFTGRKLRNAHNALADARACFDVYRAMVAKR